MADLLLLEPVGGIAGDMFLAAALDAGVDAAALEAALRTLGVPGWRLEISRRVASGIVGTHVDVVVGPEPGHRHDGGHGHGHGHGHAHAHPEPEAHGRSLADILALVDASGLSPRAKAAARDVFERIGRAEAKVHGIPVERVHFHEVGAVDSIVDACGAAVALDLLGWPRVVSAVPELGSGTIRTAHGALPVPPPAVLELLAGKPVRMGGPPGEAVTPTGAALLAAFAEIGPFPAAVPERVGYGIGTASWPDRPNVLRATVARSAPRAEPGAPEPGDLWVLECNLDDCPGQLVARAIEAALEAGALDAWAAPLTMKKGRPGVLVGALVRTGERDAVARVLLSETTTLGVRRHRVERDEVARELVTVETAYGPVRMKIARLDGRELGAHPEYDDCLARARERGVAVREVMAAALAAHRRG